MDQKINFLFCVCVFLDFFFFFFYLTQDDFSDEEKEQGRHKTWRQRGDKPRGHWNIPTITQNFSGIKKYIHSKIITTKMFAALASPRAEETEPKVRRVVLVAMATTTVALPSKSISKSGISFYSIFQGNLIWIAVGSSTGICLIRDLGFLFSSLSLSLSLSLFFFHTKD